MGIETREIKKGKRINGFIVAALMFSSVINAQLAVRGELVYTMAGETISNGVVLIKEGKFERIGSNIEIPSGYRVLSAKVITPGLIDAHTVVGLSGIYNQSHDQDQLEKSAPIQPELRAIDAYNPNEELIEYLKSYGVTTLHTGHAPGALASGQTMVVKTHGHLSESVLDSETAVTFALSSTVNRNFKKPGTRSKSVAMLREEFYKAEEYIKKLNAEDSKQPARNLKLETLSKVLSGELKAVFTVNTATEILSALRIAREFELDIILDGAVEGYLLLDELRESGYPAIIHPTMTRTKNASFETAALLNKGGLLIALQSGFESYVPKTRVVLFEAAVAAANGMSKEDALASITINAAKIIGQEDRIGSIEVGKDADLVLYDGDPFEYTSHVCQVIINGEIVKEICN
jgi:imidazolonepropionase-like amidohydrolase